MTPTDRARRSDALYYDTQNVARRSLCDMIAQRESDLEKLQELVRDMWEFFCVVPEDEPHVFREELDFSVEVWRRMCELGVEVSE